MAKMEYLIIHTTDTPYQRKVTKDDIRHWHLLPVTNQDGTITYKGKKYQLLSQLPNEKVGGLDVKKYPNGGRGWSQVGYSDLIEIDGKLTNLVPYNFDNVIDSNEVTNGATGYNSKSRHVVLAGGWSKDGKIKNGKKPDGTYMEPCELYSPKQIDTLIQYIQMQKEMVPDLKILGHNMVSQKTCPNFDVEKFIKDNNLE